jgi:YD repeat-containing protein
MRGNVTDTRKLFKEGNRYLSTTAHFDIAGNALAVTDPKGNTTATLYDSSSSYAYPVAVTNALGHITSYVWWNYGYFNGDLQSITDANGVQTEQYWYDSLGRKTQETTPTETKNSTYDDYDLLATSYTSAGYGYTTSNTSGQVFDIQQSMASGENVETTASYNGSGQVVTSTPAYRAGSYPGSISYDYDSLGRITNVTRPAAGYTRY